LPNASAGHNICFVGYGNGDMPAAVTADNSTALAACERIAPQP
jgi:hypothetical protein